MWKVVLPEGTSPRERPAAGRRAVKPGRGRRAVSSRFALEPRLLFDGAAFAVADAVVAVDVDARVDPPVNVPPIDASAIDASTIETAPIETAPIETAPIETAPIDGAPIARQPADFAWGDASPRGDGAARVETRVIATSAEHTDGTSVAIGEVVTFRTVIVPGAGRSENALLVQELDDGLVLVGVDRISADDGIRTGPLPVAGSIVAKPGPDGAGTLFVVDLGSIESCDGDATIVVEFRARVDNSAPNRQGRELSSISNFVIDDDGACGAPPVFVTDASDSLDVVEPHLSIEVVPDQGPVEPGGVASFTVTLGNDGPVSAFDVGFDDLYLPAGLSWREGSFVQVSGPRFDVSPAWNGDASTCDGPAIGPFAPGAVAVFRFEATVGSDVAAGESLPVDVTVRYTSLPGDGAAMPVRNEVDVACSIPDGGGRGNGDTVAAVPAFGERTGFGGPGSLDDYVASDAGSVVPGRSNPPVRPAVPGDGSGGTGGNGAGGSDGANAGPGTGTPGGGSTDPSNPAEPGVAGPHGLLAEEDIPFDDMRPPLSDLFGEGAGFAPLERSADLYAPLIPDGIRIGDDLPAVPKGSFGRTDAAPKDDDCLPAKTPSVKRSVVSDREGLAKAAGKPPVKRNFSEQIGVEQRRFRAPVIVRPQPPDC